jgi:cell division protein FtsI (penicillin-binding protein 3)
MRFGASKSATKQPMKPVNAAGSAKATAPGGWRRGVALGFMAAFGMAVFGRAFYLQVVDNDFLNHEGDRRHIRTVVMQGNRGAIRDRRGEPLALSAPVDSIWTVPSELLGAPPYLAAMANLIGYTPRELDKFLTDREDRQFVYLKRQIDPDEAKRILALRAPGVFAQREYRRYYPAGEVAAHVVGFTDVDGKGQEGIESARDGDLRGTPGSRRVIRARDGRVVEDTADVKDAQPGEDITLTLDLRLQYLAYRELKTGVTENHAKGGLIVIADPKSGDILAIASYPGYNPNRADDRDPADLRNRAVNDSFEPGSTIKALLIAQALETHAITTNYAVDTGPGYFKVGSMTVRDEHVTGMIDLSRLLSRSSNVGAAKVGLAMGADSVWSGYQKFGIGEPVASGLPGEAGTVLRPAAKWGLIETATASFGYGVTVNALQLVRAYCALANDGLMPQLSIVKRDHPVPPQRVVSERTARDVRKLLEGVIETGGTAPKAAIAGYRVAGKTGTVKKNANGGYLEGAYQSVFAGMMPAEHPRLVGLIMIDDPKNGRYFGGDVSAPVFSHVLGGAARLLQIEPDEMPAPAPKTVTASLPGAAPVSAMAPAANVVIGARR